MREIRHKSAAPFLAAAAVWILWCLLLPLYSVLHFILLIIAAAVVGFVFGRIFPGKVEYVEIPPEPVTTGDEKCDELLRAGEAAIAEMERLRSAVRSEEVREKTAKLITLTDRIFKDILEDPGDYRQIKRFSDYYLPAVLKLLSSYERLERQGIDGENIVGTMDRIKSVLDTTVKAYEKQLDALFADQAFDIDTDITVLEGMLKREGLSGGDFDNTKGTEKNG